MASHFGKIEEFSPKNETFSEYEERLNFFFEANEVVKEEKKRAILLTVIGVTQFRLLKDLAMPSTVQDLSFTQLCKCLKEHHEPAPPKYLQRAIFEARVRKQHETPQVFIAELRHLAEHCVFGAELEERLCEKFARGINCPEVQRKLLAKQDLKLKEAVEIATATMKTTQAAKELQVQVEQPSDQIHFTRRNVNKPSNSTPQTAAKRTPCYRCGGPHAQQACKFKGAKCYKCERIGHIAKVCRSSTPRQGKPTFKAKHSTHHLSDSTTNADDVDNLGLFTLHTARKAPIKVDLHVNNKPVSFQLDTGAALSVMTEKDFHTFFKSMPLQVSTKVLQTYTGQSVSVLGECVVEVNHNGQQQSLPLLVVKGNGPPLMGRNWLEKIQLDWTSIFCVNPSEQLEQLLQQYDSCFGQTGVLNDRTVKLYLKPDATPKYCKARQPPFTVREGIEEELARLQNAGIIKKVQFSDWATPIVPVRKSDGTIRICGDYKITLNKAIQEEKYPIPRIEELTAKLAGGEKFSSIDFSHAYTQLQLDPESRLLTTINTHRGLFEYQRLCFGISSCPSIFQRVMDSLFQDVPNTCVYFDNLYLTGANDADHLQTLTRVLDICREKGLAIKREKCAFLQNEVDFLGYRLNKRGLQPQEEKLKAIRDAPAPQTVHQLKSFVGLMNYYARFIDNLSQRLAPLYSLLNKNARWHWGTAQVRAFNDAKQILTSDQILIHFDPTKHLVLTCDASPDGLGAVLSHWDRERERPIAFASRTLSAAEKKYSQLDKEALSLVFGVKKFHNYLYGQHFTLVTDHKPLLGLFGEMKAIPEHASARVQRWAILLFGYNYNLVHRPGAENNADTLSRLPLPSEQPYEHDVFIPEDINFLFNFIDKTPLDVEQIAIATQNDPILKLVHEYTMKGWPNITPDFLRPFKVRRHEISVEHDCLLWGTRVIVPQSLYNDVLVLLHDSHVGMAKMKAAARSWVWWPTMDANIEQKAKLCQQCQLHSKNPAKAPLHNWEWPSCPWDRIHCDFAGPFLGKMYLVLVDSHSKWLDVRIMPNITASQTILEMRDIFSVMGLPNSIVTDNGPTWTSAEFQKFMYANGIHHITVSPYHPSSNGLAERAVQIFKSALVKIQQGCVKEKLCRFLTKYRSTPHSTTGICPSELLIGRKIKTHLDLFHPNVHGNVQKQQERQKKYHDKIAQDREIAVNDDVVIRNYSSKQKWLPGTITEQTGPVSFKVQTKSHGVVKRHQDQIRVTGYNQSNHTDYPNDSNPQTEAEIEVENDQTSANVHNSNAQSEFNEHERGGGTINDTGSVVCTDMSIPSTPTPSVVCTASGGSVSPNEAVPTLRRSARARRAPDKLNL